MEGEKQNRRVILLPIPLQGHITPSIHLANLLHSQGFSITIIQTRFNPIDSTQYPHFSFVFIDDGLPEHPIGPDDINQLFATLNRDCLEPFRDCLSQILSSGVAARERVACLVADPIWSFAGSVAKSFNLPWLVLRTSSMSAFVINESIPTLRQKGYFLSQEGKADEPVHEFPPLKVGDLPTEEHHELLATVVKDTKASNGIICNSFDGIEAWSIDKLRQSLSIPIFPIGPLHKRSPISVTNKWTQDQSAISWLDTQAPKSVLYVSFGSIAAISETEFLEIAWGLAESKQPFLWVVRPGLSQGSEARNPLPEGYLEKVRPQGHIVRWAPQVQVLSHPSVGGFWTHNGWNSTVESISEGVPMLCFPFFVDQAMNARHVCDNWRVGIMMEKQMKRDEIKRAIRKLMVEEEGKEMRYRVNALKESAEQCLKQGGSSYTTLEALTSYISSF